MAGGHGTRTTNPNNIDIPDILFRRERGTKKKRKIQKCFSYLVGPHSSIFQRDETISPFFAFQRNLYNFYERNDSFFYLCVCWQLICEADRE